MRVKGSRASGCIYRGRGFRVGVSQDRAPLLSMSVCLMPPYLSVVYTVRFIYGLYRNNGKENGNYHVTIGYILRRPLFLEIG